jgi:hypothetical protein
MGALPPTSLNFGFLAVHHERLILLGAQAGQVFHSEVLADARDRTARLDAAIPAEGLRGELTDSLSND